ncbi:hypothetical protein FDECE_15321 [Fusarium decemcellulare]|nr:hypothetical protein FDECE_15321 [Fusarium decemcellulare]
MTDVGSSHSRWAEGFDRHKRSIRITDDTWERFKPLLCALYKSYTLQVVMLFMKKRFGFYASKRQYGYRFEKWGIKKYNASEKKASMGALANLGDHEQSLGEMVAVLSSRDAHALNTPFMPSLPGAMPDDIDNDDCPSAKPSSSPVSYPWSTGTNDEAKKLAADFCAAMLDDENAFSLYLDLYGSLSNSEQSSPEASTFIAISCARVAGKPDNAQRAQEVLSTQWAQQPAGSSDLRFVLSMLMAYVREQHQGADKNDIVRHQMSANINHVLDKNGSLVNLDHNYSAIDLVAYYFLSHGLDEYEQASSNDANSPVFSPEHLLNEFVTKQPFVNVVRRGDPSPLLSCIKWCSEQLGNNHPVAFKDAHVNPRPAMRCWWDNIRIFCTLWRVMLGLVRANSAPIWYTQCESAFGISASELLVTVSWVIGTEMTHFDHADVLKRAAEAAETLMKLKESEVWVKFLTRFLWMNELVDPGEDEKSFEVLVRGQLRQLVSEALGIQLPYPAGAGPELDLFGIDYTDFGFDFVTHPSDFAMQMPSSS